MKTLSRKPKESDYPRLRNDLRNRISTRSNIGYYYTFKENQYYEDESIGNVVIVLSLKYNNKDDIELTSNINITRYYTVSHNNSYLLVLHTTNKELIQDRTEKKQTNNTIQVNNQIYRLYIYKSKSNKSLNTASNHKNLMFYNNVSMEDVTGAIKKGCDKTLSTIIGELSGIFSSL